MSDQDNRLAILVPRMGIPSETFIRRHVNELHSRAAVVCHEAERESKGSWTTEHPALVMQEDRPGMIDLAARKLGLIHTWGQMTANRFLRRQGVTVIMCEYLDFACPWFRATRGLGIPFFAHAHGYDISRRLGEPVWRERYRALGDCAGVITMSRYSAGLLGEVGLPREKIHVIPYGIDVPDSPPTQPEKETVDCIAVGRMVGKKAPLATLEAFRRARAEVPALRLAFIGDGPLFGEARAFVEEHGLGGAVELLGVQPNEVVRERLRESDLFLQHSRVDPETGDTEGLPVGILEAMAAGLPVVSTRHVGIPEAVAHEETGLLGGENDIEAMAASIVRLALEGAFRRGMGEAGWSRAKEHFSWETERRKLRELMGLD